MNMTVLLLYAKIAMVNMKHTISDVKMISKLQTQHDRLPRSIPLTLAAPHHDAGHLKLLWVSQGCDPV